jgi:hypothetical protein
MKDNIIKTFELKLAFGTYPNCYFVPSRYRSNNNLALQIQSEDEGPICVCTVNPNEKLSDDVICIKDYSENEGMAEFLKNMGIIGDRVKVIPSGWVELYVYELTEHGKEIFKSV